MQENIQINRSKQAGMAQLNMFTAGQYNTVYLKTLSGYLKKKLLKILKCLNQGFAASKLKTKLKYCCFFNYYYLNI